MSAWDVNSMKPLDNLCHPVSVIKAQKNCSRVLFAAPCFFLWLWNNIFCAKHGTFLLQGRRQNYFTQKRIRVINAWCYAVRFRLANPEVDNKLGISPECRLKWRKQSAESEAVVVLVNNPTYYGICSDLRTIVQVAHAHKMLVLVERPTVRIYILERICRSAMWTPERIWHLFPCINPAAVLT